MASRGLGVTPEAMDASRLVFVSVKDAKPKRKVAVPVPDSASWDQFLRQVAAKLKISGVAAIYLAASGEQVMRLDQLQDIDELYVVEGPPPQGAASPSSEANGYMQQQRSGVRLVGVADTEISAEQSGWLEEDADSDAKYAKRQTSLQRTIKRVFPSLFASQSLPVTSRDVSAASPVEAVRRRIRRRRRSCFDPRTILMLFTLASCLATVLFVYLRAMAGLP